MLGQDVNPYKYWRYSNWRKKRNLPTAAVRRKKIFWSKRLTLRISLLLSWCCHNRHCHKWVPAC